MKLQEDDLEVAARVYAALDVKTFLTKWIKESPTHHFSLGVGHHAASLVKIAGYLKIEAVVVKLIPWYCDQFCSIKVDALCWVMPEAFN